MSVVRMVLGFLLLLSAVPAQAGWLEATTKHFRIYSEGKAEALTLFATKVERFDAMLRKRFNVGDEEKPQRLTIFMLRSNEAVAKIHGGKTVLGFYEPHASGSLAVVHRENGDGTYSVDADTVLFHEYAHHFMLKHFPVAYPAWFVEGFAEFISTADFTPAGNAQIGKPPYFRGFALLTQTPIPARQLLSSDVGDFENIRIDAFYGRSWLLTHFLTYDKTREGQLNAYLRALNGGATSAEAATKAFGELDQLDKDLKAYLNRRKITYSHMIEPTPLPGRVTITPLDSARGALVMHRLALMREPGKEEAAALVPALSALVAARPTAEGHWLLSEAQLSAGQYDAATASADDALKIDPALARALMVKAYVAMRRYATAETANVTKGKEMRALIVQANRADLNDPLPMIAYHSSFQLQGQKPTPVALDGLRRAYQMVPEAIDVRMHYAFALATLERWDEAIRLVETVAFAPHQNGNTEMMRFLERLKKAKAGDKEAIEALM